MADEPKYKVAEDFNAVITLLTGKEIKIDLTKVTAKEWKEITKPGMPETDELAIIGKACGLKAEELLSLSQPDYRFVLDAFLKLGTQPLTNPT